MILLRLHLALTKLPDAPIKKFSYVNVTLLIYCETAHGRKWSLGASRPIPVVQEEPFAVILAHAAVGKIKDIDIAYRICRHTGGRGDQFVVPTSIPSG